MIFSHKMFRSVDGRFNHLIISCTATAVEATLVYYENNQPREILMQTERQLQLSTSASDQDVYDQTIIVLEQICEDVSRQSHMLFEQANMLTDHQQIHDVSVFVSAPWTVKKFYNKTKTWDKTTPINQDIINSMLSLDIPQGHTRLDSHLSRMTINGYVIDPSRLHGQSGKTIDISVLDVFMRIDLGETLFQVVHSQLNIGEDQFQLLPVASAASSYVEHTHAPRTDHIQLFVYYAYSEAIVWQGGVITHAGKINFGAGSIVDAIKQLESVSTHEQALSLLQLYANGDLHEDEAGLLRDIASVVSSELKQDISQLLIGEFATTLPRDWYVYSPHRSAQFFTPLFDDIHEGRVVEVVVKNNSLGNVSGRGVSDLSALLINFVTNYDKNVLIR